MKSIRLIITVIVVLLIGLVGGYLLSNKGLFDRFGSPKDKYTSFLMEVYDTINENYWDDIPEEKLLELYTTGTEKFANQIVTQKPKSKIDLQKTLVKVVSSLPDETKKKEFATSLADAILATLEPNGRSRLYGRKEETGLANEVNNINPDADRYKDLGVSNDASQDEIEKAHEEITNELQKESSPEAKKKLAEANKAFQTLSDEVARKTYDQSGVESTLEYKLLKPSIFYLHLTRFSPTTIDDLVRVTSKVDKGEVLDTLIFDLRDNIGGDIDGLPFLLGPFIGNDQYAYQFFHRGDKTDFKTKTGWLNSLVRYKKIVVLTNGGTMSSAEVMTATLKKYNVGVVVGTNTKGWGTVERVFELKSQIGEKEKYSVFLVHSLTLREDGKPIEGVGVEPNINITAEGWEKELYTRFGSQTLIDAVKEVL
ncbi:MAG: S41 family peptidase [bacterium]|nr:S41 family peptidase [bacterium]